MSVLSMQRGAEAVSRGGAPAEGELVIYAYNDLGMHCMNDDFSEIVILPPYNTVRAQVLRRGEDNPDIEQEGLTVRYSVPSNTRSSDKTNFWVYAPQIFGVALEPDIGLTGHGLSGEMEPAANEGFEVTGIPITPFDDTGRVEPYPIGVITVDDGDGHVAMTQTVVPVSAEMTCSACHRAEGMSTASDILADHDRLHGTTLMQQKPVLCASCHADAALGAPGQPGVSSLSSAMHGAHADRMDLVDLQNDCYACHPGVRTQCHRDVHLARGMACVDCHGGMEAVGDPQRQPWADQPRCGDCHSRPGFQFEQPGKLFKDSVGHAGVQCAVCHGSPHALTPTTTEVDNLQATLHQGFPGVIQDCTACHTQMPSDPFFHKVDD